MLAGSREWDRGRAGVKELQGGGGQGFGRWGRACGFRGQHVLRCTDGEAGAGQGSAVARYRPDDPKSATFAAPSSESRTFAGLMPLCTIPRALLASSAASIWSARMSATVMLEGRSRLAAVGLRGNATRLVAWMIQC